MAEDLVPLMGNNMHPDGEESSDSEDEFHLGGQEDPDAIDDDSDESDNEEMNPGTHGAEGGPPQHARAKKRTSVASNVTYDISLPGTHSYLGDDMEDVRGRTLLDDDSHMSIPILSLPGVVLVPGQTLPLHIFQPMTVAMVRNVMAKDKTFGLVTSRYLGHDFGQTLAKIGTTAEILAFKEESDDSTGITTVRVKAIGRQRFKIKESRRQGDGTLIAQIRILAERELPPALEGATPASHRKLIAYREESSFPNASPIGADVMQRRQPNKRPKLDRLSSANFTWWPPWVYKQYDAHLCMRRVVDELQSWNDTLKQESMPRDPIEFSFWVTSNLPLDDGLKLHLLKMDCAVQRLRCELSLMQKWSVLCCKECELLIANKKDVFSMALEGPMGAYVNPGGHVHETFTVYKAQGLNLIDRARTENSWFPGYAWTIVQCRHCNQHMGWKFTAVNKKLKPDKFWGLCRTALLPGLQRTDDGNTDEWKPAV